jgi:uncharacterized Fe-S radical SAM superfamily protein PflX
MQEGHASVCAVCPQQCVCTRYAERASCEYSWSDCVRDSVFDANGNEHVASRSAPKTEQDRILAGHMLYSGDAV